MEIQPRGGVQRIWIYRDKEKGSYSLRKEAKSIEIESFQYLGVTAFDRAGNESRMGDVISVREESVVACKNAIALTSKTKETTTGYRKKVTQKQIQWEFDFELYKEITAHYRKNSQVNAVLVDEKGNQLFQQSASSRDTKAKRSGYFVETLGELGLDRKKTRLEVRNNWGRLMAVSEWVFGEDSQEERNSRAFRTSVANVIVRAEPRLNATDVKMIGVVKSPVEVIGEAVEGDYSDVMKTDRWYYAKHEEFLHYLLDRQCLAGACGFDTVLGGIAPEDAMTRADCIALIAKVLEEQDWD